MRRSSASEHWKPSSLARLLTLSAVVGLDQSELLDDGSVLDDGLGASHFVEEDVLDVGFCLRLGALVHLGPGLERVA
jgi:hypothetical protein